MLTVGLPPTITPTLPTAAVAPAAPAAPQPQAPAQAGALRSGLADTIRTFGEGMNAASHEVALVSDKTWIYPVEAAQQAGGLVKDATKNGPKIIAKGGSIVGTGIPYATGFYGLIFSGMLQAPGNVARDLANGIADSIDGQKTRDGFFGFDLPIPAAEAAPKA